MCVILRNKVLGDFFYDVGLYVVRETLYETPFGSNRHRIESVVGIVSQKFREFSIKVVLVVFIGVSLCISVPLVSLHTGNAPV